MSVDVTVVTGKVTLPETAEVVVEGKSILLQTKTSLFIQRSWKKTLKKSITRWETRVS